MPNVSATAVSRARVILAAVVLSFAVDAAVVLAGGSPAPLRTFVTSTSGGGDFGTAGIWEETEGTELTGFAAADKICQVRAEAATPALAIGGFPAFRAWISIGSDDAYCHVLGLSGNRADQCGGQEPGSSPGPYYRVDGIPFADDLEHAATLSILGMPSRTENGVHVGNLDAVWTGIGADGTPGVENCDGWTSNSNELFGLVGRSRVESEWYSYALTPCGSTSVRIYCFQEPGESVARQAWPEPAALVFLIGEGSTGDLDGLAGADILCQDDAQLNGLPDPASFRAWLSDGGTDARDRVIAEGPWYRPDGVRFAESRTALLVDRRLDSPISVTAAGAHLGPQHVWTSTFSAGTKASEHCSSWFSADGGTLGVFGQAESTNANWTVNDTDPCDATRRFYCFGNTIVIFWDGFETADPSRWSSFEVGAP